MWPGIRKNEILLLIELKVEVVRCISQMNGLVFL